MLLFQLHAKAQQAKVNAEEAGMALKQRKIYWCTNHLHLYLFLNIFSPLCSGLCVNTHRCFTDVCA